MKITTTIRTVLATLIVLGLGVASAPIASATYPMLGRLGSELTMTDSVGQVVLGWTVSVWVTAKMPLPAIGFELDEGWPIIPSPPFDRLPHGLEHVLDIVAIGHTPFDPKARHQLG